MVHSFPHVPVGRAQSPHGTEATPGTRGVGEKRKERHQRGFESYFENGGKASSGLGPGTEARVAAVKLKISGSKGMLSASNRVLLKMPRGTPPPLIGRSVELHGVLLSRGQTMMTRSWRGPSKLSGPRKNIRTQTTPWMCSSPGSARCSRCR